MDHDILGRLIGARRVHDLAVAAEQVRARNAGGGHGRLYRRAERAVISNVTATPRLRDSVARAPRH